MIGAGRSPHQRGAPQRLICGCPGEQEEPAIGGSREGHSRQREEQVQRL